MTEVDPDPKLLIGDVFESAYSLFSDQSPATQPYEMYVTGEGTTFDNAEAVTNVIETFLTDLQYIDIDGYGPRQVQINVWVTAENDRVLGRAENDLMRQLYKPTLLWWRPPRHDAPWSVFEVATSELKIAPLGENDFEEASLWRKYTISLTCGAWVRGMTEEVAVMPAGNDFEEVLNDGSETGVSLAGLGRVSGTLDDSAGYLIAALTTITPTGYRQAQVHFGGLDIDPSVTPLLVLEGDSAQDLDVYSLTTYASVRAGGVVGVAPLAADVAIPGGFRRYYTLPTPLAGMTWDTVAFSYGWNGAGNVTLKYEQLLAVDQAASIGSLRQKMFDLEVKGSVVARGGIEVANEDPVGSALVYSFFDPTDGLYMPVLTPWRDAPLSTSSWTTNATMASGHLNQATAGQLGVYIVPLDTLPDGTYDLVIKAKANGVDGAVVSIYRQVYVGNALVVEMPKIQSTISDDAFLFYTLGQVTLPLLRTSSDGTAAGLVISVANEEVVANTFQWDDLYLLNIDTGAYTLLKDLGTPSDTPSPASPNFISLESPSFEWPASSVMVGVRDQPPTYHTPPGAKFGAVGRHELAPGRNRVLVVTDAVDSEAAARYYPRGHTNMEW